MIKKLIGSVDVFDGKAEYLWNISEDIKRGNKTIYVSYVADDGYILSESWEKAFLKTPTSIIFENYELFVSASENQNNTNQTAIRVKVFEPFTDEPVNSGMVQFQVKTENDEIFTNIGMPVDVIEGIAECEYTIHEQRRTTILFKAIYIGNNIYADSETENYGSIYVRGKVNITVESIKANKGDNITINATVENADGGQLTNGELNILIDDEPICEHIEVSPTITHNYDLPEDILHGEHELKVEYLENNDFDYAIGVNTLFIRIPTILHSEPVYADQTYMDGNNIIQGQAHIPLDVRDPDGNLVEEGTVILNCDGTETILSLPTENELEGIYNIGLGTLGGTEIPFTIDYHGTDDYLSNSIQSKIIVRYKSNIRFENDSTEPIKAEVGDTILLKVHVTNENGENVNDGYVTFELDNA